MLEKLSLYLENTPQEEILRQWEKASRFDNVGITMTDVIEGWSQDCVPSEKIPIEEDTIAEILNNKTPKKSRSFFLSLYYEKSKLLPRKYCL